MSAAPSSRAAEELPPDNTVRVAIFDAMHTARDEGHPEVTIEELRERVLPRLRVLVPRELHNATEPAYVEDKVQVCLDARPPLLLRAGERGKLLTLSDYPPRVRYPNDEIRDYTPTASSAPTVSSRRPKGSSATPPRSFASSSPQLRPAGRCGGT